MRIRHFFVFVLSLMFVSLASCGDSDSKDIAYPVISDTLTTASPVECDRFYRGETIHFHALFTDNVELGNFNIEVHNNFEHHSHGTSATDCELDPVKAATPKVWVYNESFSIPANSAAYDAYVDIPIPDDIDTGDYHFVVRVTDAAGWQSYKAFSVKILE